MYHVGSPEMLEGNRFFPLTGTPISKRDCRRMRLADCDPVPLAVAMLMVKSLMMALIRNILLDGHQVRPYRQGFACTLSTCCPHIPSAAFCWWCWLRLEGQGSKPKFASPKHGGRQDVNGLGQSRESHCQGKRRCSPQDASRD